jgi:histidyl-tRNA synthetase
MRDLIAGEAETLNYAISKARETAQLYSYKEVITPIVEPFELLSAKSGDEIRQRMFIFDDLGGRKVSLRPEFTASIARLVTTALKNEPKPLRLFSVGSVYRYDEPQRGRYREFWQANFELVGSYNPEADAEIILLSNTMLRNVGLTDYALKLGHVGVLKGIMSQEDIDDKTQNAILQKMDKKEYESALGLVASEKCRTALRGLIELKGTNVLDTVEKMRAHVKGYDKAVAAVENLSEVLRLVTESGCDIQAVDPGFARGLEYYTGIIFELYVPELDMALGGGGRYDRLIEAFGGEPTPSVGMAAGLDRIALAMQMQQTKLRTPKQKKVTVIAIKAEQKGDALKIAQRLRESGVWVEFEVMGRKMVKALEDADKRKADYAVIVGERELKEGKVVVKDLAKRTQVEVEVKSLCETIWN